MRILVVCTGNVCRSPFVERVLRAQLDADLGPGHGIGVASRGTQAIDGDPLDERMVPFLDTALAKISGSAVRESRLPEHRAVWLAEADVVAADLIITATRDHRQAVARLSPHGLARTFTIRQLAVLLTGVDASSLPHLPADRVPALARAAALQRGTIQVREDEEDVVDPHGRSPAVYEEAVKQLLDGVEALAAVLARRVPPQVNSSVTGAGAPAGDHGPRPAPVPALERRRRRRGRRVAGRIALVTALLVLAGACWVGVRGALAYRHLQEVQVAASRLKVQLAAGGTAGTAARIAQIEDNARAAHRLTSDPIWRAAQWLPLIGGDLRAAGTAADVVDQLGQHVLKPVATFLTLLTPGATAPSGPSRFATDIAILGGQHAALAAADAALAGGQARLAAVDTHRLPGAEARAIETLTSQVGIASAAVDAATRASTVLPLMFDTVTPKTYLLMFQNPAEARSLGGIAGAYAVVSADHGHFRLLSTGAGSAIRKFPAPVLPLGAAYASLFGNQPTTYFLDTTQTPYFPDAAQLAMRMWQLHSGHPVDGVISADPLVLADLLAVTGPVTIPGAPGVTGRTLTSTDAVPYLLNGVYTSIADPNKQNLVFAETTAAVFSALSDGRGGTVGLVKALRRGAGEGRLFVWDSNPAVAAALAGTSLSGVPSPGSSGVATVGLYLNDGTGSKMSWYLRRSATLAMSEAPAGAPRTLTLTCTLSSVAPTHGLPPYVSGNAAYGVPVGTSRNVVYVLAPVGGSLVSAEVDGVPQALGTGELHGRNVGVLTVDVAAGGRHTITVNLLAPAATAATQLMLQPLAHP